MCPFNDVDILMKLILKQHQLKAIQLYLLYISLAELFGHNVPIFRKA